jgi:hypothetical protein
MKDPPNGPSLPLAMAAGLGMGATALVLAIFFATWQFIAGK